MEFEKCAIMSGFCRSGHMCEIRKKCSVVNKFPCSYMVISSVNDRQYMGSCIHKQIEMHVVYR